MAAMSFNAILVAGALSVLLLTGLSLRLLFAKEVAQGKAATARIRGLHGPKNSDTAQALLVKHSRQNVGRVWPIVGDLALKIRRAGLEGGETKLAILTLVGGITASLLLVVPMGALLAMPAGAAIAAGTTLLVLKTRHKKRVDAFVKQLPDALDLMMRGLRVGHPVNATIINVGRTMSDPIGSEFRTMSDQIARGDYLSNAFNEMAQRLGQEDVEYLSVAINIQHGTGGNLAEMLDTLSKVVRDRIIMRRRVKAISSEGRISAYLLSALPVVIYAATSFSAPDYYGGVSDDPLFLPIGVVIVALVLGNFLALRKLVSFEY